MKFVNLTPHEVRIINGDSDIVIPTSGVVARAKVVQELIFNLDGIPVYKNVYGETIGLPAPSEGVIYIVSALAAQGCSNREDVFVPNDSVRDENGKIVGCRSLARI